MCWLAAAKLVALANSAAFVCRFRVAASASLSPQPASANIATLAQTAAAVTAPVRAMVIGGDGPGGPRRGQQAGRGATVNLLLVWGTC